MISRSLFILMVLVITTVTPAQVTWHVSPNGSPQASGSATDPFDSIQRAIEVAGPGGWFGADTILVAPGLYEESLDLGMKELVIRGSAGPASTTLMTPKYSPAITIDGGQSAATVVDGLTITHRLRVVPGAPQSITTQATGAWYATAADLDGDGDLDFASASGGDDKVAWYENLGNGTYGPQQVITTLALECHHVHAADLDGDGDLDLASADYAADEIAWYENLGGSFGSRQVVASGVDGPFGVHADDLDGDGDLDLLSASQLDHTIAWYENLGGSFGPQQVVTSLAGGAHSVRTSDVDGDGDADVIASSSFDSEISWYRNLGGGTFGPQVVLDLRPGTAYRTLVLRDLDGDGDEDLLAASQFDASVSWFENLGGGAFGSRQTITSQANGIRGVDARDLDGDGDLDVIAGAADDSTISWHENLGAGSFGPPQTITTQAPNVRAVLAEDADGDGDPDVLACYQNTIAVFPLHHDGAVAWGAGTDVLGTLDGARSPIAADLDNDGDQDVLACGLFSDTLVWGENLGAGVFAPSRLISNLAMTPAGVYPADLDGDGDLDVLSASGGDDEIAWYENQGTTAHGLQFGPQQVIHAGTVPYHAVAAADLDGDLDPDILAAGNVSLTWIENLGGGSFATPYAIQGHTTAVEAVDLDGDGDVDVLGAGVAGLRWSQNLGGGSFAPQATISTSLSQPSSVRAADLDGDGDLDVVACSPNDNQVGWHENLGSGSFGPTQIIFSVTPPAQASPLRLRLADVDGDGDPDVLFTEGFEALYWIENLGAGNLASAQLVAQTAFLNGFFGVDAADIDGDGAIDVIGASSHQDFVRWYRNLGALGSGIAVSGGSSPVIEDCVIEGNDAASPGGGVLVENASPTLRRCVVRGNRSAQDGGGVAVDNGAPRFDHCTIAGNQATLGGGIHDPSGLTTVIDSIVWGNGSSISGSPMVTWSAIEGGYSGTGNIASDPLFVRSLTPSGTAAFGGDLRVRAGSPAIGTSSTGTTMGAHEFAMTSSTRPGSGEDFVLATGINGAATLTPDVKLVTGSGAILTVEVVSPAGTFDLQPLFVLAQTFATGSPPSGLPGFPELHVNPVAPGFFALLDPGVPLGPFGPPVVIPGGNVLQFQVPPGLSGQSVMLQGAALDPTSLNGFFAATDAHELRFMP